MVAGLSASGVNALATGGISLSTTLGRCQPQQRPGILLEANDGVVDDFLEIVDGWEEVAGHPLMPDDAVPVSHCADDVDPQQSDGSAGSEAAKSLLDRIARDFSAPQMRALGASLLKLADALDQDWHPARVKSQFGWMTRAGQIERRALNLAQVATSLRAKAKHRTKHLSPEFLGEPAWEMLIELFVQFAGGAKVSTKSLCIASGVPDTTAMRLIDRIEGAGLLERTQSPVDKRITLVGLTKQGVTAVGMILMDADC